MEETKLFIRQLQELRDSIKSIDGTKFVHNHKRVLLFSLIDLMAKAIFSDSLTNKKRFVNFILEFCEWEYADHVSLQQLVFIVNKDNSSDLSKVRQFANEKINSWPQSQPIVLSYDPSFSEVVELWPSNYKALGKIHLNQLTHANLLWKLRNSLVHELRPLGYESSLFEEKEPHYTPMRNLYRDSDSGELKLGNNTWQLSYPIEFYYNLIDKALNNLANHFITNQTNPYDNFRFGSEWLDMD